MVYSGPSSRNIRDIKNRVHLLIEEDYIIVLSDYYAIMIDFDEIFEHLEQLLLLPTIYKIFSVPLVEGTGEEIDEHYRYRPISEDSHVPEKIRDK